MTESKLIPDAAQGVDQENKNKNIAQNTINTEGVTGLKKKERKFNNDIDAGVEIFNLGYKYWMSVYKKVENERVLSFSDIMFIKSMSDIIHRNGLPTSAQAKRLIKIFNTAEDAGIVFE